jgi:hypothetical protein
MYRGIRVPTIEIGRRYRNRLHLLRAADQNGRRVIRNDLDQRRGGPPIVTGRHTFGAEMTEDVCGSSAIKSVCGGAKTETVRIHRS